MLFSLETCLNKFWFLFSKR